jgi:hypothetical protein
MLTNRNAWCVVTYYKENYSLLPAFMSYYRGYFGIRRALIFCGRTQGRTHEALKQSLAARLKIPVPEKDQVYLTGEKRELTLSEFVDEDFVLWVASYPTEEFNPFSAFNKIKADITAWGASFLPSEISRTLVVDADEFLYVKNPQILNSLDNLGFHFLDMVPSPVWPPEELRFSLQGWYYRRQAQPLFKYGKWFALPFARATGRGLQHNECKTFFFDRKHMGAGTAWHHGTIKDLSCCFALNRFIHQPELCREILQNTAFCYHLAMTCKEFFLTEKLRLFNRVQTDPKLGMEEHEQRGAEAKDSSVAERTFDNTIKESIFPVMEDNFLLPYLQQM